MRVIYLQLAFIGIVVLSFAQNSCAQSSLILEGHISYAPNSLSNLWGYVDSLHGNEEYALVGVNVGLSIVDVTNPTTPVQKFLVPGDTSYWREVKTFAHRAYVTNETGGGLQIINLDSLPNKVNSHLFTDNGRILRAHTLWIDEHGYLYLFGTNVGNGGAQIYDLNPNPDTPIYAGQYDDYYIHDGFVRGDTLWASHIYAGNIEVVNVSDKMVPVSMAVFNTPGRDTHSSWPTSNDHYIFATDEIYDSYMSSFDVQKMDSIEPEGVIQADPGSGATVHNVYLYTNDFATTSYYCQGVVIFDVTYPDNMIEVANYNTSEAGCNGLNGCWGEYPYLPSGNIIASDIQDGLYILKPNYVHACWLVGRVQDSNTGDSLINVHVSVIGTQNSASTNVVGFYKTGVGDSGTYSLQFSATGYYTQIINNVHLVNGAVDTLNVKLDPLPYFTIQGTVFDTTTDAFISNAKLLFQSNGNTYVDSTDENGNYVIADFFPGNYKVFVGKWGYDLYHIADSITSGLIDLDYGLLPGFYYDDFTLDLGWKDSGTAASGQWVRGVPIATVFDSEFVNPNIAAPGAHDDKCYMTGNSDSGNYRISSLYGGWSKLTSPLINLTTYNDPMISYYTWFFNLHNKYPANDSLVVTISSKNSVKILQTIKLDNTDSCQWVFHQFRIGDFVPLSDSMYVSFFAQNTDSANNVLKAAIDVFQIADSGISSINMVPLNTGYLSVYPNPFENNVSVSYNFNDAGEYQLEVTDIINRVVYENRLSGNKGVANINLKNLPSGIYIFQLKANNIIIKAFKVAKIN